MKPSTEKRYRLACHRFFDYLQVHQTPLPSALHGLDDEAARYFDFLWEEGEPLSFGADLLSGLQHFLPETKRHLPFSWRLLGAWRKHELPSRAMPFLPSFALALAGWFHRRGERGAALAVLLGFLCLLRTAEMTLIQWKDISRNAARTFGVLLLPTTKSGQRFGYAESVPISDPTLLDRCMTESFQHVPGDWLVTMAPGQFRKSFADGCLPSASRRVFGNPSAIPFCSADA